MSGRLRGAAAGGLLAGLGLTVLLVRGERSSGTPSELVVLERTTRRRLGLGAPSDATLPSASEQVWVQGGHLALSTLAGAAYALTTDGRHGPLRSGTVFGLAFYGLAHWIVGPLLGAKAPEWRSGTRTVLLHAANHVGFGIATALGAQLAAGPESVRR